MEPPYKIFPGDCRTTMQSMPEKSVHCVVTSPPYFGLRDYGHGDQIGLEETPEQYVAEMVSVFREVRRVLRDDGTVWLNLGDSYASAWGSGGRRNQIGNPSRTGRSDTVTGTGLKEKDLMGIPWRVAFALQSDGWYLRQDIIWHKPNPMPESVTDRCTKAHEYIFLLTKKPRYYYDAEAVKEPANNWGSRNRINGKYHNEGTGIQPHSGLENGDFSETGRNRRSVWTVATQPYSGAHFATFPRELVRPCILAGCPVGGIVLDPFAGSGTTLQVAIQEQRIGWGCELNPEYIQLLEKRLSGTQVKLF
jgi:DNA modification methylase